MYKVSEGLALIPAVTLSPLGGITSEKYILCTCLNVLSNAMHESCIVLKTNRLPIGTWDVCEKIETPRKGVALIYDQNVKNLLLRHRESIFFQILDFGSQIGINHHNQVMLHKLEDT